MARSISIDIKTPAKGAQELVLAILSHSVALAHTMATTEHSNVSRNVKQVTISVGGYSVTIKEA